MGFKAIPMAADTGPIGGPIAVIILAETGESKIYADKNIFEIDPDQYKYNDQSLEKMRNDFTKIYAVTDEKFNEKDFSKK